MLRYRQRYFVMIATKPRKKSGPPHVRLAKIDFDRSEVASALAKGIDERYRPARITTEFVRDFPQTIESAQEFIISCALQLVDETIGECGQRKPEQQRLVDVHLERVEIWAAERLELWYLETHTRIIEAPDVLRWVKDVYVPKVIGDSWDTAVQKSLLEFHPRFSAHASALRIHAAMVEKLRRYVETAKHTGEGIYTSITGFCEALGIDRQSYYQWKNRDPMNAPGYALKIETAIDNLRLN